MATTQTTTYEMAFRDMEVEDVIACAEEMERVDPGGVAVIQSTDDEPVVIDGMSASAVVSRLREWAREMESAAP